MNDQQTTYQPRHAHPYIAWVDAIGGVLRYTPKHRAEVS